jgi:GNAT superfamily N-acetyltransferase
MLQRRFFMPKKGFSEREKAFFLDIDFEWHVAIVAEIAEDGRQALIGGGRFIVVQPGQAEIAFIVVDAHQGRGIGTILMQHLAVLARGAGLEELVAEVLPGEHCHADTFQKVRLQARRKRIASGSPPETATAVSTEDPVGTRPALPQPQQRTG